MLKKEKRKIKIGILAMCAVSLSYMGFSPIIAVIADTFPNEDISLIQMILTIPNLMFIIFSPLSGALMLHMRKKKIVITGITLYLIGGLFPFFFHSNIWFLLFGSLLIGSGSGLLMPAINGLICDYYDMEERGPLMGLNATFVAVGALCFIFLSGILSSFGWHYSYLVFLFIVPVLILVCFCIPRGDLPQKDEHGKTGGFEKSGVIIFFFIIGFIYFITQNAFNTNSSLLVEEYNFTNAATLMTLTNTVGGLIGGLSFGLVLKKAKNQIMTVALVMATVGFAVTFFVPVLLPVTIGSIMVGYGFAVFSAGGTFMVSKFSKPVNNAFTIAMYNAFVNLGASASPYFINSCSKVFGDSVQVRYLFSGIVLLVLAVIAVFGYNKCSSYEIKE